MSPVAIWITISSLGSILSILSVVDAVADYRSLGDIQNGRRIYARGRVGREAVRLVVQVLATIAGFAALDNAPDVWFPSRIALIICVSGMTLNSAMSLWEGRQLRSR